METSPKDDDGGRPVRMVILETRVRRRTEPESRYGNSTGFVNTEFSSITPVSLRTVFLATKGAG